MFVFLTQYDGIILGPIAKLLGFILQGIYAFFSMFGVQNTGLCIILFTFIVNSLMIPITLKQQKFSKMNTIMAPEIQAIQNKYKNKTDQESVRRMQMEQQAVYTKYGVSATAGCLPLLITFPIIFALYRVIYNVPAYVPQIKEIYENLINAVAQSGISIDVFTHHLAAFVQNGGITDVTIKSGQITSLALNKVDDVLSAISMFRDGAFTPSASDYIVDILSQFREANWVELWSMDIFENYPNLVSTMKESYGELKGIYNFLGMNIMERPTWKDFTLLIPILAVVTQFVNNKIITAGNKTANNKDNPTAASMNMMNNIMPFVSGFFCFSFPIGVGLYWVAGSIFRIIQSLFINMYFDKVSLERIAEKQIEKANKKLEKKGINPNSTKVQQVAKTRTSSINANNARYINRNSDNRATKGSKQDFYVNHNIKGGSISDFANMMNRDYVVENEKDDKKDKKEE